MVSQDLLDILRCPACVRKGPNEGFLKLVKGKWLVCQSCGRKYPIHDDIPVMLIEEGDKYRDVPVEELEEP
ncbi:MAG: Trm112 family protein [Chloroflexota bacterium]|nr:Trm112 family protein [Chloroflexota bacterium]